MEGVEFFPLTLKDVVCTTSNLCLLLHLRTKLTYLDVNVSIYILLMFTNSCR